MARSAHRSLWAACATLSLAGGAWAQSDPAEPPVQPGPRRPAPDPAREMIRSPILTLDQDRLFQGSAFGQRVRAELEAATTALATENRRVEGELTAEESDLTERRARMPAAEFRKLADAFDAKVTAIREAQDAKARSLSQRQESSRQRFYEIAFPLLADLVREVGAVAILDTRAIVLSSSAVDITDLAIERVDAAIGDGIGTSGAGEAKRPETEAPAVPAQPQATPPSAAAEGAQ